MIIEQDATKPKIDANLLEEIIKSKTNLVEAIHFPPSSASLYLFNYHDITVSEEEFNEVIDRYKLIVEYENNPVILSTTLDILAQNYDKVKDSGNGHKPVVQIPIKAQETKPRKVKESQRQIYDLEEQSEEVDKGNMNANELENLFDSPETASLEDEEISEEYELSTLQKYMKDVNRYELFKPELETEHAKKMYSILKEIAKETFKQEDFMSKYLQILFNEDHELGSFKELMPVSLFNQHNPAKRGLKEIIIRYLRTNGIKAAKEGDQKLINDLIKQKQDRSYLVEIYNNIRFARSEILRCNKERKGLIRELGFESEKNLDLFVKDLENRFKDYNLLFDEFVNRNYRLVVKIAHKYKNHNHTELLDLIQEGNIGLIRAAERFDSERGYKFSSYATWWIHQAIMRSLDNNNEIRIPIYLNQKIRKIRKISDKITKENGIDATPDDIAEYLGISVEEISDLLQLRKKIVSLHVKSDHGDGDELIELIKNEKAECPENSSINQEALNIIEESLKDLSPLERNIMKMRYCIEEERSYTVQEIGDFYHLSKQRISQIEHRVLERLRLKPGSLEKLSYENKDKKLNLEDALKMLTKRQYRILIKYYGINSRKYSTREIVNRLRLTRHTVKETVRNALRRMGIKNDELISLIKTNSIPK